MTITTADVPAIVEALLATATVPGPLLAPPAEDRGRTIRYWGVDLDEADLEWAMEQHEVSLRAATARHPLPLGASQWVVWPIGFIAAEALMNLLIRAFQLARHSGDHS